jgi:hypothetical protein
VHRHLDPLAVGFDRHQHRVAGLRAVADGVADRLVEGQEHVGDHLLVDTFQGPGDRVPEVGKAGGAWWQGQVQDVRQLLVVVLRSGRSPPTPVADGLKPPDPGISSGSGRAEDGEWVPPRRDVTRAS